MRRFLLLVASAGWLVCVLAAQEASKPEQASKSTTVTGCLVGPDADNLYTLTSMQHRTGLMVVGGEELKAGAGEKVKLTGTWETLPGSTATKGDAGRRFRATEVTVMDEKCQPPQAVTPVSKKKQEQQQTQPKK